MLRSDRTIMLADRGASIDHLTAAANTAALIETVSKALGQRVLNSADPDVRPPNSSCGRSANGWTGTES